MKNYTVEIAYLVNGKKKTTNQLANEDFTIQCTAGEERLEMVLTPKQELQITSFCVTFEYSYSADCRIFVNGYQSWTDSREYHPGEMMTVLNKLIRKKVMSSATCRAGDLRFFPAETERGHFHGYSYSYIRRGETIDLFGSVSERSGYTIWMFDAVHNKVTAKKDLDGVTFTQPTTVLDIVWLHNEYDAAFDRYFEIMEIPPVKKELRSGYTTWYNYYGNVTEEIVRRDLEALSKMPEKVEFFQIDDGYQSKIGDWLITNKTKFPSDMKAMADAIHDKGMKAGLWLAPFAAVADSEVFKNHRDWFLCENGEPYQMGHNWGGFYAIDIYNEEARAYIKHFFDVVLNEWGYDMVKLDFLYACCGNPIHNKTRGQVMCDGMDLVRECVGDKMILGCGVPMAPAFGKVDFCRIGADMGLSWNRNKFTTREDVSTPNAINNAVFRRHLDGRAFLNDPDVFLLRDNNIYMNLKKRKLIAKINHIFGNILFTSDNVERYNEEQVEAFLAAINKEKEKVISADLSKRHIMTIIYEEKGRRHTLEFNVENGRVKSWS